MVHNYIILPQTFPFPFHFHSIPFHSWLHHSDATVGQVGAVVGSTEKREEEESSDKLEVHAILSEATLGKFMAKFGDSVSLTETR